MIKRFASLLAAGIALPGLAQAQVMPVQIPVPLAPGVNAGRAISFASGNEWYAFIGSLSVDATTGSGHGLIVDTIGTAVDTELAMYGANGLVAFNDDGGTDPATNLSVFPASVLTFGDEPDFITNVLDGATTGACTVSHEAPAGQYTWVLSYYNTTWGCPTPQGSTRDRVSTGASFIHGSVF